MNQNFYIEKIMKINKAIDTQQFQQALKLIDEELKMPYIPEIYEKQFWDLKLKIKSLVANNDFKNKQINLNTLIKMLYENSKTQSLALSLINKYNLRPVQETLKHRIESWDDKTKKVILFEILSEQAIDIDLNFDGFIVNPVQDSIFNNKEIIQAFKTVDDAFIKNPQLQELAKNEIKNYLLINFPNKIKSGIIFGTRIINIIKFMINSSQKLTNEELKMLKKLNKK